MLARLSKHNVYFNPRSPYGERRAVRPRRRAGMDFNPRSPYGERRRRNRATVKPKLFQPTLPVWGATWQARARRAGLSISTHAPRMGSDRTPFRVWGRPMYFNPRSPYGERPWGKISSDIPCHFNPRSPYGERRGVRSVSRRCHVFQPTLPVWGATADLIREHVRHAISTHAPRMGSDGGVGRTRKDAVRFQPTLPVWGAT